MKVVLDGGTLLNWLVGPQPLLPISALPSAIWALAHGNPAPIATTRAVFTDPEGTGQFGYGLDYGVFCSEWDTLSARITNSCSRTYSLSDLSNLGAVPGAPAPLYDPGLRHLECSTGIRLRAPSHNKQHPDAPHRR